MTDGYTRTRRWYRLRYWGLEVMRNLPLILGTLIILTLVLVAVCAPFIAPRNPYEKHGYGQIGDEWVPPYSSSEVYPLGSDPQGRDMLSLLIYGSQQTLLLAFVVMLSRVVVGCIVGGLAAWSEGRPLDQMLMSLSTAFSSFPALILAGLLVLAFGLQSSLTSFTIALCFVGWGEIAQFVRSQVLVIRRKEYIESARAVGLRESGIVVRHLLPNILPQLVALMALEMAAVLLVLGELGFLNIFFGGGTQSTYEVGPGEMVISTFEVAEWGAMLATSRQFIRSKPWVAFYPALAFFIAAMGFALMGGGLRRLADKGTLNLRIFFNRYVLGTLAVIVLSTYLLLVNFGPLGTMIRLSRRADGETALAAAQELCKPQFAGRRAGTPQADAAADWLAGELQRLGLEPAGEEGTYFQSVSVPLTDLAETPQLIRWDAQGTFYAYQHRLDFREVLRDVVFLDTTESPMQAGAGSVERAEVVFVPHRPTHMIVEMDEYHWSEWPRVVLYPEDVAGKVVLTTLGANFDYLIRDGLNLGVKAVLVVVSDDGIVTQRDPFLTQLAEASLPVMLIRRQVAEDLVAESGYALEELERKEAGHYPLGVQVSLSVALVDRGMASSRNVLALYPGRDTEVRNAVILAAHYDGLGKDPNGTVFPGANDGASGCGVLLEMAELWEEQGFVPEHPVLFAFWSGQEEDLAGVRAYLEYPYLVQPERIINRYVSRPIGVITLDYVGQSRRLTVGEFLAGARTPRGVGVSEELGGTIVSYIDTATGNRLNPLVRSCARMLWTGTGREVLITAESQERLLNKFSHRPFIEASVSAALLREPVDSANVRTFADEVNLLRAANLRKAVQVVSLLGMRLANGR